MPYDPTPLADGDTLTLQLQGTRHEPETVLVLARPAEGRVLVREYPTPGAPAAYEAPSADVLARVEAAARAGRRVGAELYAVRRWLAGGA